MKNLKAYRNSNKLTFSLKFLISFTFLLTWLPFIRSILDGKSYVWGTTFYGMKLGGHGISTDFTLLIIQMAVYALLFIAIYRIRERKWYYFSLILWFLMVFGNLISEIIIEGDSMFHGDALNIHLSLSTIIFPLSAIAAILIFLIIRSDRSAQEVMIPWNINNRKWLIGVLLIPLPIQAVLLATGEVQGLTDQIGVIICILQCFLIPYILKPYRM